MRSTWKSVDVENIKGPIRALNSAHKSAYEQISFETNRVDFAMDNVATAHAHNEKSLFTKKMTHGEN